MRYKDISLAALILVGLALATGALQRRESLEGAGFAVDGDTIDLAGTHVRLAGIDAPELYQQCERDGRPWACGTAAREALAAALRAGTLSCASSKRDVYGRPVARCRAGTLDLSEHMAREGFAVAYRGDRTFAAAEADAKAARRGIWAGTFEPPAAWRAAHPRRS